MPALGAIIPFLLSMIAWGGGEWAARRVGGKLLGKAATGLAEKAAQTVATTAAGQAAKQSIPRLIRATPGALGWVGSVSAGAASAALLDRLLNPEPEQGSQDDATLLEALKQYLGGDGESLESLLRQYNGELI